MSEQKHAHPVPLYASTIHRTAASGDLSQMKSLAAEAEAHLKSHGDVSAALEGEPRKGWAISVAKGSMPIKFPDFTRGDWKKPRA